MLLLNAAAAQAGTAGTLMSFLPLVLIFVIFISADQTAKKTWKKRPSPCAPI
jgi:preprotein translocase subunit YajC